MMNSSEFNGLLLVDKPAGISSHDVVSRLRRILKTKAVGHSGTLDPMASGLMACLVNEGTKLSQYILEGDKGYRLKAQFGIKTDTLDTTGQILETRPVPVLSKQEILIAAESLIGEFDFPVPIYSAIKIQGKKLYEYAREEEAIEVPKKRMKFWDLQMVDCGADWVEFDIKCSKVSYIRTWIDQLGEKLGCGAAMSALRRTYSAPYLLQQASTFEQIEEVVKQGQQSSSFVEMAYALPQIKRIRVKGQDKVLLGNGQISHDLRRQLISMFDLNKDQYIQVLDQETENLLAIIGLEEGRGFVLKRVFKYS